MELSFTAFGSLIITIVIHKSMHERRSMTNFHYQFTTTGLEDSSLSKDKFIGASIRTNDGANDADPDEEAIEDTP